MGYLDKFPLGKITPVDIIMVKNILNGYEVKTKGVQAASIDTFAQGV